VQEVADKYPHIIKEVLQQQHDLGKKSFTNHSMYTPSNWGGDMLVSAYQDRDRNFQTRIACLVFVGENVADIR
jgi:hypothetical protein